MIRMRAFFTGSNAVASVGIRWVQGALKKRDNKAFLAGKQTVLPSYEGFESDGRGTDLSHCGPIFDITEPYNGLEAGSYYFESWHRKDEETGKTGVRGPLPLSKLEVWANASIGDGDAESHDVRSGNRIIVLKVPPYPSQAENAFRLMTWAAEHIHYAHMQILQNLRFLLWGRGVSIDGSSPLKWTCCEALSYCMTGWIWKEAARLGIQITADQTCPMWMYHAIMRARQLFRNHQVEAEGCCCGEV